MLIKFKASDPRAGMTVRMDSNRGQVLVDNGSAVRLKEDGSEDGEGVVAAVAPNTPAAKPSEGLKVDELKAALEAKGIPIPAGAKKDELAALLDGGA